MKNEVHYYNYRGIDIEEYNQYNQVSKHHKKNLKNSGVMVMGYYLPNIEIAVEMIDNLWVDYSHAKILENNNLLGYKIFGIL